MTKISIITINYNNLEGLKRTVDSVIHQTWKEFEYIIIDGDSTDGSKEYMESQNQYFDYWLSEKDSGIYNAMNKGIQMANGDYLLFLNSGDELHDSKVLEQNHGFLKEMDFVYFNLNFVERTRSWVGKYPDKLSFSHFVRDTLPHPATFIKRKLFKTFGLYDEKLKVVSDWKFFVESICKYNCSYIKIDQILSTFYLDGISSDPQNKELINKERRQVLESGFTAYIEDTERLFEYNQTISRLRKSRKIKLLVKLGLVNKF